MTCKEGSTLESKAPHNPDLDRDRRHVWHPCTPMKDHETHPPLLIEKGEGVYLVDGEGRRYLDVIASWWVNLFGHNHPRLNAALQSQLAKVAHVMFAGITHRPAIDLAERLVQKTPPHLTRVFFSDNGSTAVEIALKMSLQYWQQTGRPEKTRFIYLRDGYHGETLGALAVCGTDLFREKFKAVLAPNIQVNGPDCYRCPFGLTRDTCRAECFDPMQAALDEHAGSTAGVIVEPLVQGAAGMKMYPAVYLEKLQAACEAAGVHVIYDEVAVGFGRTGSLFVCEGNRLRPTFLCLSKGITSGYLPLAATLTEESIYEAFYDEFSTFKWFVHSHSYAANPLACAVANATLDLLAAPEFFPRLHTKIKAMEKAAQGFRDLPWFGEFRQTGLIGALELVRDPSNREPFPIESRVGFRIYLEALKRGLYMRPLGNVVYFIPPYVISEDEIFFMMESAKASIQAA
ncbi:MAG: adenosylmethionine--8-amino-7-oxononanoate transaminase, partial [Nitrospinaceae bacterium]